MTDNIEQPLNAGHGTRSPLRPDAATVRAVRAFRQQIADRYSVREILLFGSRARGTHAADSDADLAVVLAGESGPRSRISGEMAEIAFDVLMETGILVQAMPVWEGEWRQPERFSNPALLANIQRDGMSL